MRHRDFVFGFRSGVSTGINKGNSIRVVTTVITVVRILNAAGGLAFDNGFPAPHCAKMIHSIVAARHTALLALGLFLQASCEHFTLLLVKVPLPAWSVLKRTDYFR